MDERRKQDRLEAFEALCRQRGIPCTLQRRLVLEAVLDRSDHPTGDQIYRSLARNHSGISRATVHRALVTLVRLGMITKACHPGKTIRYDGRTEIHHHLVCLRCDKVIDFFDPNLDALRLPEAPGFGFEIIDFRVQLRGVCRECRAKE